MTRRALAWASRALLENGSAGAVAAAVMVGLARACLGAEVTLIWDASSDPEVVGYNVYCGLAPRNYTTQLWVGAETTVTIGGLVPGRTYYFAATSQDGLGREGRFSQEIAFTAPWPPPQLPTQNDRVITVPGTLTVTNAATAAVPSGPLAYRLLNPPAGAYVNSNGIITWTPTPAQRASTNFLVTVVSDDSVPPQSATNTFMVVVMEPYHGVDLRDPMQAVADWDGDGLSNLAEYAVGGDPTDPGDVRAGLNTWVSAVGDNQYLMMRFKQRLDTTSIPLEYFPEVSADGKTWYSDSAHVLWVSVVALDFDFNEVTVRDQTPVTDDGVRFIRLRIVEQ